MNILITAGGTAEKIDDVRSIGNLATGRLGSLTADRFLENPEVCVTYLCARNAARPRNPRARVLPVSDVRSLQTAVENEMRRTRYDAVVHSMAVSDYTVRYSVSAERLAQRLAQAVRQTSSARTNEEHLTGSILSALLNVASQDADVFPGANAPGSAGVPSPEAGPRLGVGPRPGVGPRHGKISSEIGHLFLCLDQAPKIIGLFKKLQPQTVLVGFKLLADAEENELIRAAETLMKRNGCDFVLANDRKDIGPNQHKALLLEKGGPAARLSTKEEIADAIKDRVMRKIGEVGRK